MKPIISNNSTLTIKEKINTPKLSPLPTASVETSEEVRTIGISEHVQAAASLAEAFAKDEISRYFIDTNDMAAYSDEYKWKLHVNIMRYITAAHCYKGIVTTIEPDHDAVALWMPPGANMDDIWTILRSGMVTEGRTRFFSELKPLLHQTKHDVLGVKEDDSYYLVYLGTKPSARGKGYAKKLIEHMTGTADLEGKATYLESSAAPNISYYRKYGFMEKKIVECTRGEKKLLLHIMVRESQMKGEVVERMSLPIKAI
ncbi:hypothetical protein BJ878DRAFT_533495 [Calycina marina]|uniref:N-acetyltransferase domain-containing protein n=1 Tax=Calycina marina TaxID=1763456 RepID=A0A9P8CGB6_9HELO|nr:hypothetical protein BJ878DRAFT_533495 [Calycina marina]